MLFCLLNWLLFCRSRCRRCHRCLNSLVSSSRSCPHLQNLKVYINSFLLYSVPHPLILKLMKYPSLLLWNHAICIFYRFLAWHCAKPDGEGQNKGNNLSRYPHGPSILYSQLWSWSYGIYCSCHETLLWNWRQNWKVTSILMYYFLIREKSWFAGVYFHSEVSKVFYVHVTVCSC